VNIAAKEMFSQLKIHHSGFAAGALPRLAGSIFQQGVKVKNQVFSGNMIR